MMRSTLPAVAAALSLLVTPALAADGDARRGAELYRACVACHTLAPGQHTSGPSLAGVMGRPAGTAEGFGRYSPNLRDAGFDWDAVALDAWLADPETMVPGTYMDIRGIPDEQARADLIAFLEAVTAPGGAEQAVAEGLIPPPDRPPLWSPQRQLLSRRHGRRLAEL